MFKFFHMIFACLMAFQTKLMAKVEGPLMSLEARGKIGDAMVFFPWKGRHVVRQWVKPTNPQSTLQGYARAILKTMGKWIKNVENLNDGDAVDSVVYQAGTSSARSGVNWNAWLLEGLLNAMKSAGSLQTGSWTDLVDEYSSLAASILSSFAAEGTSLGLVDHAFSYGYTTNIPAGLQLYCGAKSCYNQSIIGTAPYNTDPASWDTDDVGNFADDHTT
jgi:hypothetical protein